MDPGGRVKAILEFNLPEDQKDLVVTSKAQEMLYALKEMNQWITNKKFGDYEPEIIDAFEWTLNEFIDILNSFDIANLILRDNPHKSKYKGHPSLDDI